MRDADPARVEYTVPVLPVNDGETSLLGGQID
jgi:hypothetical protein